MPTRVGVRPLERYGVTTTFPLGLFRAWTWIHQDLSVLVYPRPADEAPPPPPHRRRVPFLSWPPSCAISYTTNRLSDTRCPPTV